MKRICLVGGVLSASLMSPAASVLADSTPSYSILEATQKLPQDATFLKIVKAAGLTSLLQGKGSFTVFVPLNDAFAKLPSGTVETLLKPENKALLVSVVKYHILPKYIRAIPLGNLPSGTNVVTLSGEKLIVRKGVQGMGMVLDTPLAQRTGFDSFNMPTKNGIMHHINGVLLPPNVVRTLSKSATSGM